MSELNIHGEGLAPAELTSAQWKKYAMDYGEVAERLTKNHGIKVYSGKTGMLGPEDRYCMSSLLSVLSPDQFSRWYGTIPIYAFHVSFYIISSIIQEFVARGCMQTLFQRFFEGKYAPMISILLANLMFSMLHLYVSLEAALLVFVPGLFWGWLYQRHHSLPGVSVSHILIGVWAMHIVIFW